MKLNLPKKGKVSKIYVKPTEAVTSGAKLIIIVLGKNSIDIIKS